MTASDHSITVPAYCPMCGNTLEERDVEGDNRPRLVCDACGHIHYLNPKVVAAAIPEREGRLLLARRAIEPRHGFWTFPSGFMELGETVEEAAIRETWEEVLVEIDLGPLLSVYSRPVAGVVIVVFHAAVRSGEGLPGPESLEVRWFEPQEIPWDHLAFDSTRWALRDWVQRRELPPAAGAPPGPPPAD